MIPDRQMGRIELEIVERGDLELLRVELERVKRRLGDVEVYLRDPKAVEACALGDALRWNDRWELRGDAALALDRVIEVFFSSCSLLELDAAVGRLYRAMFDREPPTRTPTHSPPGSSNPPDCPAVTGPGASVDVGCSPARVGSRDSASRGVDRGPALCPSPDSMRVAETPQREPAAGCGGREQGAGPNLPSPPAARETLLEELVRRGSDGVGTRVVYRHPATGEEHHTFTAGLVHSYGLTAVVWIRDWSHRVRVADLRRWED